MDGNACCITLMETPRDELVSGERQHPLSIVKLDVQVNARADRYHFVKADSTATVAMCFLCTSVANILLGCNPHNPKILSRIRHVLKHLHAHVDAMPEASNEVIERLKIENEGVVADSSDQELKRCLRLANNCLRLKYRNDVDQGDIIG